MIVVVLQMSKYLGNFCEKSQAKLHANLEKLISACPCPPLEEMLRSPQLLVCSKIQHHFENWGDTVDW